MLAPQLSVLWGFSAGGRWAHWEQLSPGFQESRREGLTVRADYSEAVKTQAYPVRLWLFCWRPNA